MLAKVKDKSPQPPFSKGGNSVHAAAGVDDAIAMPLLLAACPPPSKLAACPPPSKLAAFPPPSKLAAFPSPSKLAAFPSLLKLAAACLPPLEEGGRGGFAFGVALAFALLIATAPAFAQVASDPTPPQFRDAVEERRFQALTAELRCVKCQNQSLADSNAQVAHDLRMEVLALMRQGRTDAEIETFLVQRYGSFVLYRPRVDASTWLLWFGPAALLVVGAVVVLRVSRRRDAPLADADTQEW